MHQSTKILPEKLLIEEYYKTHMSGMDVENHQQALYTCGYSIGLQMLRDSTLDRSMPCRLVSSVEDSESFTKGVFDSLSSELNVEVGIYWVYPNIISEHFKVSRIIHRYKSWMNSKTNQIVYSSAFALDSEVIHSLLVDNLDELHAHPILHVASMIYPDLVRDEVINSVGQELLSDYRSAQWAIKTHRSKDFIQKWRVSMHHIYSQMGLLESSDRLIFMPEFVKKRIV